MQKGPHSFGDVVAHLHSANSQIDISAGPLWTVEEVAAYLRIKPTTVRAMCRRGELEAIKVGRSWRFNEEYIQKFLTNDR